MSSVDLRLGRWEDVLADVTCDTLIVDAPYSERTHDGHAAGEIARVDLSAYKAKHGGAGACPNGRNAINYDRWSTEDVAAFVAAWHPRTRGWFVSITDSALAPVWQAALAGTGRYVFPPLPFLEMGKQPRLTGDGPASWTCWIVVARPSTREFASWGSLPGGYTTSSKHFPDRIPGGKPLPFMRSLVRDYSRLGDVVCDPCCGGGTTLIAAAIEGRTAIGSEMDAATHAIASKRLARGYTPSFLTGEPAPRHHNEALL